MRTITLTIFVVIAANAAGQTSTPTYSTGITLMGSQSSCPLFIGGVYAGGPAERAGVKAGDILVAIDSHPVVDLQQSASMLRATEAKPVTLALKRGEQSLSLTVAREKLSSVLERGGWKRLDGGYLVKTDFTDEDIRYYLAMEREVASSTERTVAFPGHYPKNKQLYYPGFAVFLWGNGANVTVGGMEEGPASRAGLHWGDRIVSINGVEARAKSAAQIESLLSREQPSLLKLVVERAGKRKEFSFDLERASAVLAENGKQVVDGRLLPAWLPAKYFACF